MILLGGAEDPLVCDGACGERFADRDCGAGRSDCAC